MKDIMILPVQIKSIKDDDEYYYVEGVASPYGNTDLGKDRVQPGAFTTDLQTNGKERPILWQHNTREPVGLGTFSDGIRNLAFKAKLPKADDFVSKRVMPQLKVGSVKGCSIGYDAIKWNYNNVEGVRDLIELKLYETSFVTFPMNPDAQITSLKNSISQIQTKGIDGKFLSFLNELAKTLKEDNNSIEMKDYPLMDESTEWDKTKSIKQLKEFFNSKEKPTAEYKEGFMFVDGTENDIYSAFKMPYVYVDNKGLKAVPKAIYAIAASLSGARGGLDIPTDDKEKIKEQVNRYYKKLGKDLPFKDNGKCFVDVDTLKAMDKKHFTCIFDNDIELSRSAKEFIFECFKGSSNCLGGVQENESVNEWISSLKELSGKIKI